MKLWLIVPISLLVVAVLAGSRMTAMNLAESQVAEGINIPAPEFVNGKWINAGSGLTVAGRKGKVTVVEFWTFACSNCRANLPAYANWQKRFSSQGLVVVGVHTPETDSEKVPANVMRQVESLGISYPVLIDGDYKNWDRWKVNAWPTLFVVDKKGIVRYRWVGELNYRNAGGEEKISKLIEKLLAE